MAGSVHGADRPAKKFRPSQIIDTSRHDYTASADRLDRMRDNFIKQYREQTATLTNKEQTILAGQLADSFKTIHELGN